MAPCVVALDVFVVVLRVGAVCLCAKMKARLLLESQNEGFVSGVGVVQQH